MNNSQTGDPIVPIAETVALSYDQLGNPRVGSASTAAFVSGTSVLPVVRQGWKCPICQRIWSPYVDSCTYHGSGYSSEGTCTNAGRATGTATLTGADATDYVSIRASSQTAGTTGTNVTLSYDQSNLPIMRGSYAASSGESIRVPLKLPDDLKKCTEDKHD